MAYANKINFWAIKLLVVILFSLGTSASNAVERLDLNIKGMDPSQFIQINKLAAELKIPWFYEMNSNQDKIQIQFGADLNAYGLKKYSEKTNLKTWRGCGDSGLYLISYPQFALNNMSVSINQQIELLVRVADKTVARLAVSQESDPVTEWQIEFSPNCREALVFSKNKTFHYTRSDDALPRIENINVPKYNKLKLIASNRVVFTNSENSPNKLFSVALNDTKNIQLIDENNNNENLTLGQTDKDSFCWSLKNSSQRNLITIKCQSIGMREPAWQKVVDLHDVDYFSYEVLSREYITVFRGLEYPQKIIRILDSAVVFESKEAFEFVGGSTVIVTQSDGISNSRLINFDFIQKKYTSKSYDLVNAGLIKELSNSVSEMIAATARNTYGQLTTFTMDRNGKLSAPFTFPFFQSPTKVSVVKLTSEDSFQHFGYLIQRVEQASVRAVAVYVHGGGCHHNNEVNQDYMISIQVNDLVASGIPVLAVTYRNDKFWGTPPGVVKARTAANCATAELNDIESARKYLNTFYPNAPVFLWGQSHGGYLVNVMTTQDARIKNYQGVISEVGLWNHAFGDHFDETAIQHYNPDRAPIKYIDNITVPFLMYAGDKDINAEFKIHGQAFLDHSGVKKISSDKNFDFYQHPSKPITAIVAKGQDHYLTNSGVHRVFMNAVLKLIDKK